MCVEQNSPTGLKEANSCAIKCLQCGHRAGDHSQLLGPEDSPWLSASKKTGVSALRVLIHEDDSASNYKGAWKRSFPQSHWAES